MAKKPRHYIFKLKLAGKDCYLDEQLAETTFEKSRHYLEVIDTITHAFDNEFHFTAEMHQRFGTEANMWRPDKVLIWKSGNSGKLLPPIYGDMPLPLSPSEMTELLNGYGEYLNIAIGETTLASHKKWVKMLLVEYNAEKAMSKLIAEIANSYRMRRELTIEFFRRGLINYQAPIKEVNLDGIDIIEESNGQTRMSI